jgi:lysophospholipase L1-like esterase
LQLPRLLIPLALAALLAFPAAAFGHTSYYVSLGDSYAQGVQPIGAGLRDVPTNSGYTDFLYKKARKVVPGLRLVKLGCGGANTDSMINGTKRCGERLPYASTSKATSQLTYAAKFMRKHRGRIALVTISIGGNDFDTCARAGSLTAITQCVTVGIARMKANLPTIVNTVRRAAGPKAVIAGSTYPDVVLGAWVTGSAGQQLASLSVPVLRTQANPALKSAYAKRKIGFVDATAAFGGYIPFSRTTTLAPFGQIPQAVANVCRLGWYCAPRPGGPDIHLKTAGYSKMAGLYFSQVKRALKKLGT